MAIADEDQLSCWRSGGLEVGGGGGGCGGRPRRVVSATTGFGTLKPTSPAPFFPIKFIAPAIRTTYRVSGFRGCTSRITILSEGIGRCASSWRTSVVST